MPPIPPNRCHGALALLAVLLVTFVVLTPALQNDFCYDDRWLAMGHDGQRTNEMVAELQPVGEYFRSHYWRGTADQSRLYRPLTVLTFAVRHALVGDDARVAHGVNLALHLLAVALVFALLRRLRCPVGVSALGALGFGLHGIHGEVVATVVGRGELLAFCGGATACLWLGRGESRPARIGFALGTAAALFAALCAKESAIAWVPFAVCYALARRWLTGERGASSARRVTAAATLVIPTIAWWTLRANALDFGPDELIWTPEYAVNPLAHVDATTRVLTATMVWGFGLLLTVFPWALSVDWGASVFPLVRTWSEPATLLAALAALALVGITAAGLWRAPRRPLPFLSVAAFLGLSIATANLLFPIGTIFGERLLYAPSLAVALIIAWLAQRVPEHARSVAILIAGAWLGSNALILADRASTWRDNETLVLHDVETQPDSVRLRVQAAGLLAERGLHEAAARHLQVAVRLDPDGVDAWHHLGDHHAERGNRSTARSCYESALSGRPRELARQETELKRKLAELLTAVPGG